MNTTDYGIATMVLKMAIGLLPFVAGAESSSADAGRKFLPSGRLVLGANYWASHAATQMWSKWDEAEVERDLKVLAESGMTVLRVFANWAEFQPIVEVHRASGHEDEPRETRMFLSEELRPDTPAGFAGVELQDKSVSVAEARAAAEKAQQERIKKLTEAEESSVLADARRKQEESMAQQADEDVDDSKPIGLVTSYNQEWNSVLFKPVTQSPINIGLVVALRRDGNILCEAEVDNVDQESGQVSAQLKHSSFNADAQGGAVQDGILPEDKMPAVGDEVIITPFETTRDLREDNMNFGAPVPTRAAPLPAGNGTETAVPMSNELEPLPMP